MSDLNPKGTPVTVGGEEHRFLFSLNVVCEVQDHCGCALTEVINRLTDQMEAAKTLRYLVTELLNDERGRSGDSREPYTEMEVGRLIDQESIMDVTVAVLKAYGLSLPEPDEFASPNAEGGQRKK